MIVYIVGETPKITITTEDDSNPPALVDPEALSVEVKPPGLASHTYVWQTDIELVHQSLGKFLFKLDLSIIGTWRVTVVYVVAGGAVVKRTDLIEVRPDKAA